MIFKIFIDEMGLELFCEVRKILKAKMVVILLKNAKIRHILTLITP